jgi:enamine deaminase RidA (YjgF/YER057c/UK114 family)
VARQNIDIDAFHHGAIPIPAACRVDNIVVTGAISGYDVQTGRHAEGMQAQCALMFSHLAAVLAAAGAGPEHVVRMTFYVKSPEARPFINDEWVKLFPDPASRPARHTINYETPKGSLMQCDAMAVLPRDAV